MEDEQQIEQAPESTPEQEAEAFNAGFYSVRNPGSEHTPPETRSEPEASDEAGHESAPAADESPAEESPVFAGLTESQIKKLLERATRVDAIEEQLQKAHGKIGELNRTLQGIQHRPSEPTHQAPADEIDDSLISEFESQFPEFAPAVEARARRIAQEVMAQAQSSGAPIDADEIGKQINLAVMDATKPDWRETVQSSDFALWIATQPDDVRHTYATTWDHKALGKIVSGFEAHKAAGAVRTNKSKQRLESALTPESRGGKVTHAISELDAMQAGFNSVRQAYR